MLQDYKLGLRMLLKYPGLTLAGGVALALAIGVGAGWYGLTSDLFHPRLPVPDGDRIVEILLRNTRTGEDERRLLHEFEGWRRGLRTIEDLGAYQPIERNLILGDARPEPVTVAEITASAFRLLRVPPLLGRPLLDTDEQPDAPKVVVLGFYAWQQRFGGRPDAIGKTLQLGSVVATVVGVMPEGFAFPVNHRFWVPLQVRPSGYAPLEGTAVRVFGRLARGATQGQAVAELAVLTKNEAATSAGTHKDLRPRVLPYGAALSGDGGFEFALMHVPVLLVLIVACTNVGTLVYARTATRDAEVAIRYALGASRRRIIAQLFVEALVLSSVAAVVGLVATHWALKWGIAAFYSADTAGPPFWVNPGLRLSVVPYAIGLTLAGAVLFGVLPGLKATRWRLQPLLRNLGTGGSTLRFSRVWGIAMIVQVALTVVCIPAAIDITSEALRDRRIRTRFPADDYLAVRVELDREDALIAETPLAFTERMDRIYRELERQVAQEPGVVSVTFANILPGMEQGTRRAEVEVFPGALPRITGVLRTASVGPGFFAAFDKPILAGRDFYSGDHAPNTSPVIVNESFARRYLGGASPVGHRVRYPAPDSATPNPWFEIVGMVRDIGMTPTDFGEAPFMFHAASPASAYPLTMAVRVSNPLALASRVSAIASGLDPRLRLYEMRPLEDVAWRVDIPQMVIAGALVGVVSLGLFLSAAGIFSLVSVSIARRTREIGLRSALGASPSRLLGGVMRRATVLVGSGLVAGNVVVLLSVLVGMLMNLSTRQTLTAVAGTLPLTSALMLMAGLLGCVEPARRAMKIRPADALRDG